MNYRLLRLAPLMALLFLSACADGEPPLKDSTVLSAPFFAHSVIIRDKGSVWVMGQNASGQLGDGTTTNRSTPALLNLPFTLHSSAVSIGGSHTLAFDNHSTVWAWGSNASGQLGINTTTTATSSTPLKLVSSLQAVAVAAGGGHSLARDVAGKVWAWGSNSSGQLGFSPITTATRFEPKEVPELVGTVGIAAGGNHSLAFDASGVLKAWGSNSKGQLGNGTTTNSRVPMTVSLPSGVVIVKVAAGGSHNLALDNVGGVWAWGSNDFGQLGDGTRNQRNTPNQVLGITGTVVDIAAGANLSLVLTVEGTDRTVWAWGHNLAGQLGYATSPDAFSSMPTRIANDEANSPFTGIERFVLVGGNHTIVRKTNGELWVWGYNEFGQLGDGTTTNRFAPKKITLP